MIINVCEYFVGICSLLYNFYKSWIIIYIEGYVSALRSFTNDHTMLTMKWYGDCKHFDYVYAEMLLSNITIWFVLCILFLCLCTFVARFFHVKVQERTKDSSSSVLFSYQKRFFVKFCLTFSADLSFWCQKFLYLFTFLVMNVSVLFLEGVWIYIHGHTVVRFMRSMWMCPCHVLRKWIIGILQIYIKQIS